MKQQQIPRLVDVPALITADPASSQSRNPLGRLSPWAWALEPSRGCNLRCGHCATRLFERGKRDFMEEEVWRALWTVARQVTPRCRMEMAMAGEPTLHPRLTEFVGIAREISPESQIQITTNGTNLMAGHVTYQALFDAGANIIYVDMYTPREKHIALADQSGFPFYEYHNKPKNALNPWAYHGPETKQIVLMDNPAKWPRSRINKGRLGTFFNNLDWEASARFGLTPVVHAPRRRCNQPYIYVATNVKGEYLLCCQDLMSETAGKAGSVLDGVDGFYRFWLGEGMQDVRRRLRANRRDAVSQCSRCDITFSRCDMRMWKETDHQTFWNGTEWVSLKEWDAAKGDTRPVKAQRHGLFDVSE